MIITNFFLIFLFLQLCTASIYYNENKCGTFGHVEDDSLRHKSMGGKDVEEGEYPFIVGIFNKDEYICAGTLISQRHVLTAAHCFASSNKETYLQKKCQGDQKCLRKYLGNEETERCQNGYLNSTNILQDYKIGFNSSYLKEMKKLKLESIDQSYQQFYHFGCLKNDLAILTLALDGNETQRPYICLPHTTGINIRGGIHVSAFGWGEDPIKRLKNHEILQELSVGLWNMKRCLDSVESWSRFPVDGICVDESNSKNTCRGDSGGPLISTQEIPNQNEQKFRHVLIGILSFGTNCDELRENTKAKNSVYTRLDFYQQKFNEIIGWKNENLNGLDFSGLY